MNTPDVHDDGEALRILEHLNHGPVVFFKWRADHLWPVLYVSENVLELTGYPGEKFMSGMRYGEILHPEDLPRVEEESRYLLEVQHLRQYKHQPYRIIHRDGSIRWVREYTYFSTGDPGKVDCFYGYVTDITAQKSSMDILMDESIKYRSFFEKHSSIFLLIDPVNGQIVKANRSAALFYGYSIEELERMSVSEINTISLDEIKLRGQETQSNERHSFIFIHRLASGERRTVEMHSTPIQIYDRQYLFSVIHDISDRVHLEKELKDLNAGLQRRIDDEIQRRTEILQRYQLLFEKASGPILILSENRFLDCNDAALQMLGLGERSQIIGLQPEDIFSPLQTGGRDSVRESRLLMKGSSEVDREQFTWVYRKSDGRDILIQVDLSRFDLGDKHVLYAVCSDITEETRREREQIETERLLVQQAKMAAMGEMLGAIAHQWKQPLNALGLMIQYLSVIGKNGNLTPEIIDRTAADATTQLHYMSRTIDDFRDYLKPETDEHPFYVRSAVLECIDIVGDQLANHEIAVEITGGDFEITGYLNRFKQALINMINNARDAIDQRRIARPEVRGRIAIDLGESMRTLSITDNGGGVPEEIRDRIFEPYFTTRSIDRGTGLGLYIAKMIIESMKGSLQYHNQREGACFTIQF